MKQESTQPRVRTVTPDASVREAAREMGRWHVGFLVVVEGDEVVGVLTDRDAALRVLTAGRDPEGTLVREVMTSPAIALPSDWTSAGASALMRKHGIRKLPVVSEEGLLEGVVTADDLVLSLGHRIHALADAVRRELRNEALPPDSGSYVLGKE